jgi:lipopolysaccharide heptosyltransferase I
MNVLIVRLGALGDIIHAIPAAAALRAAFPDGRIDWLVEGKHRDIVDLVTVIDRVVPLERRSLHGWIDAAAVLRRVRYDAAIDLQGLLKSAVLARMSGAARVIGFSIWHLREKTARPFYSSTDGAPAGAADGEHVIRKNLRLLETVGVRDETVRFPLARMASAALERLRAEIGPTTPFALLNAGAAWPNKRWPPQRFGEVAAFLKEVRGLHPVVLWGPDEEGLARAVVDASGGAARMAPPTRLADLVELARAAALMISGDTGPLHIATAVGTPTVAIFGPTDPRRNGPWRAGDVSVSRYDACGCHYDRRCHEASWCLESIGVPEVTAAVQQRLSASPADTQTRDAHG